MAVCIRKIYRFFILTSLCMLPYFVSASPAFEQKLKLADSVRTEDPKKFNQLLIELEDNHNNATDDQKEQLYYLQAYQIAYSGQHNLAIQKANIIFERSKNTAVRYRSGLLAVNSYAITRDFSAGFAILDKTLILQNQIKDPQLRIHGLTVAAIFYNQAGQYTLGKEYAERILSNNPTPRSRCFANNLLIEALYNLNSMPANENQIEKMINSCSEIGELLLANGARVNLVRSFNKQGQFRKSIALLEQYLPQAEATHYPPLTSDFHALIAEYKLKANELTEAELHARTAIKQSNAVPFSLPLVIAEKTLYEIAVRRNDKAAALEHYKKYAEADKAYLTDVKARELAYQLAKHETQQKTQTIALLNKKNEVLQLEQKITKQAAQNTKLFIALLGVLLASIIFWAYRTKRTQMAFRILAETDALTGISNRDHFTKRAEQALLDGIKKKEALALVMFDLDNFKSINDRYGHATGDWVLKKVVEVCSPICRKSDAIGRLGGEEFAILLNPCDKDNALRIAERCRESIAAIDTQQTGHSFQITSSFGVNNTLISGYAFDALLSQADQALYQSKREGRNRVSLYAHTAAASL
jgi:diguanylate cyclase